MVYQSNVVLVHHENHHVEELHMHYFCRLRLIWD